MADEREFDAKLARSQAMQSNPWTTYTTRGSLSPFINWKVGEQGNETENEIVRKSYLDFQRENRQRNAELNGKHQLMSLLHAQPVKVFS